jgi:CheY-like chemotaxis protein
MFLVALTGHCSEADKRRALEAGFDIHLVKPIDMRQIASVLAQHFGT